MYSWASQLFFNYPSKKIRLVRLPVLDWQIDFFDAEPLEHAAVRIYTWDEGCYIIPIFLADIFFKVKDVV